MLIDLTSVEGCWQAQKSYGGFPAPISPVRIPFTFHVITATF